MASSLSRSVSGASLRARAKTGPMEQTRFNGTSHARSLSLSLLHSTLPNPEVYSNGHGSPVSIDSEMDSATSRIVAVNNVKISGFNSLLKGLQQLADIRAVFQSQIDVHSKTARFLFLFFNLDHALKCFNELNHPATLSASVDLGIALAQDYYKFSVAAYFVSVNEIKYTDKLVFDFNDVNAGLQSYLNQGVVEIFGMPDNIDSEVVSVMCSKFGTVYQIHYRGGINSSWIVEFVDTRVAEKALMHLNGLRFGNYTLEVCVYHEPTPPSLRLRDDPLIQINTPESTIQNDKRFPRLSINTSPLRKYASTGNLNAQLLRSKSDSRKFAPDIPSPLNSSSSVFIPDREPSSTYWESRQLQPMSSMDSLRYENDDLNLYSADINHNGRSISPLSFTNTGMLRSGARSASPMSFTGYEPTSRPDHSPLLSQARYTPDLLQNPMYTREELLRQAAQIQLQQQSEENLVAAYRQRLQSSIQGRGLASSRSCDTMADARMRWAEADRNAGHRKSNELNMFDIAMGLDKRTTFMIRNIPNKFTQQMLIDFINETHYGEYDFIYLRIDFVNQCNVGYSFINFARPESVISFAARVVGMKWGMFNSEKVCMLSYANIQGKQALINKFRNSSVMLEDPSWRPKIFYTSGPLRGQEEDFPMPESTFRPRSNVLFSRENAWVAKKSAECESIDSPSHQIGMISSGGNASEPAVAPEDGLDGDTLHQFTHSRQISEDDCDVLEKSEIDVAVKRGEGSIKSTRKIMSSDEEEDVQTAVTEDEQGLVGMVKAMKM